MTTIKVYGKIRSNRFSGNYTPCARRAKQVFTYCTCLRLGEGGGGGGGVLPYMGYIVMCRGIGYVF